MPPVNTMTITRSGIVEGADLPSRVENPPVYGGKGVVDGVKPAHAGAERITSAPSARRTHHSTLAVSLMRGNSLSAEGGNFSAE